MSCMLFHMLYMQINVNLNRAEVALVAVRNLNQLLPWMNHLMDYEYKESW